MEARLETERQAKLDDKRAKRAQLNPPPPPAPAPKSVEDDLIHDDERNDSHQISYFTFRHTRHFQTLPNSCLFIHQVDSEIISGLVIA